MDRSRRGEDPFLDWKVRIFFAGAALMAAAVVSGQDILALVAAAVLGAGVVLMLIARIRERRRESAAPVDEEG